MSKRPKTANAVMSRLRRPAGRLRDLPIWSKLGLIMLVPTLATIIVGTSGLIDHINEANNAERARTLIDSVASGGEAMNSSIREISESMVKSALANGIAWLAAKAGATLRGADPSSR